MLASLKEKESTTDNKTTSVSDNKLNDQDDTLILKNFSDSFVQSLKEAKADAIKRYETTLGSIDDRAERLIEVKLFIYFSGFLIFKVNFYFSLVHSSKS